MTQRLRPVFHGHAAATSFATGAHASARPTTTEGAIVASGNGRAVAARRARTHFFSPNPFEHNTNPAVVAPGMIRATWQHSRDTDTSTVWAKVNVNPDGSNGSSSDPAFVAPGAVAWLLLKVVGAQDGPTGGDTLTATTFIQRLNTSGGVAPSSGCTSSRDVGNQAFVPYTADYFFYEAAHDGN